MSPATIAIIPLVVVAVAMYGGWFLFLNQTLVVAESIFGALFLSVVTWIILGVLLYCGGVVYFDSWSF